jgi:predicted nuclease of predicted toxin-antitoxin system
VIKIIVDMNLPPRWVPALKAEGWDAVHWSSKRGYNSGRKNIRGGNMTCVAETVTKMIESLPELF